MEKFLNTPLHYGRKSMIDIENMKYIVEQEIKNVISRAYSMFCLMKTNGYHGRFTYSIEMESL